MILPVPSPRTDARRDLHQVKPLIGRIALKLQLAEEIQNGLRVVRKGREDHSAVQLRKAPALEPAAGPAA